MRLGIAGIIAVAIPALEIVGIYQVGSRIGLGWTLLWLLAAMFAGAAVIRQEQAAFMPRLQQAMARGQAPLALLWASGRRFLAGVLLIIPGPFSDCIAVLLLLWPTPKLAPAEPAPRQSAPPGSRGDVIEGDFRRED
jgi:UPF0716 protein FxsA